MITIKDVALRANVSPSTASRALRRIGYISKETHDSVFRAAAELGYIANATAQQLKTRNVRTVGFIISDSNNEYYFSILSDIQKMLTENGMNLIIAFSSENPVDEETCFRSLIASRVSTIFFTPTNDQNEEIISVAKKNGIQVVQLFRDIYRDLDTIINDDESGCRRAAETLLALGCKRLLLVDVEYLYLDSERVRPRPQYGLFTGRQGKRRKVRHPPLPPRGLRHRRPRCAHRRIPSGRHHHRDQHRRARSAHPARTKGHLRHPLHHLR